MKLHAIRENHLYSKAYSKGKKFVGRHTVVYLLPDYAAARLAKANPEKKRFNRVGITVTKKIGGAVIRNRAKRVIREGYRAAEKASPIRQGNLIVIVARPSVMTAKADDLRADFAAAFKKLSLTLS